MKSRFTAYCIADVDYLYKTLISYKRKQHNKADIAQWSKENQWIKLEIINCEQGGLNDSIGIVTFKAYYKDAQGQEQIHHEKSSFCKENGQWYYIDGQFNPQSQLSTINRNAQCPCGSGKKHKKCCLVNGK
jgi:SEC-C motif-containing protein